MPVLLVAVIVTMCLVLIVVLVKTRQCRTKVSVRALTGNHGIGYTGNHGNHGTVA